MCRLGKEKDREKTNRGREREGETSSPARLDHLSWGARQVSSRAAPPGLGWLARLQGPQGLQAGALGPAGLAVVRRRK